MWVHDVFCLQILVVDGAQEEEDAQVISNYWREKDILVMKKANIMQLTTDLLRDPGKCLGNQWINLVKMLCETKQALTVVVEVKFCFR